MTLDSALSREHFQLEYSPPHCHLIELGSTNGTKVNGLRVERVLLRDGDTIAAGDSAFSVRFDESAGEMAARSRCALRGRDCPERPAYANALPGGDSGAFAAGLDLRPDGASVALSAL